MRLAPIITAKEGGDIDSLSCLHGESHPNVFIQLSMNEHRYLVNYINENNVRLPGLQTEDGTHLVEDGLLLSKYFTSDQQTLF